MNTRRDFLAKSGLGAIGLMCMPTTMHFGLLKPEYGVQLYSFREEMAKDAKGTLEKIAGIGIKKIESARSAKGLYYGLSPEEMQATCKSLGMQLFSGHVALDKDFETTMEHAVRSGQEYVICSSMPSEGQTVDNYKLVAEQFNKAGEACKKLGLKFGYHNHEYEFEVDKDQVLYDILLEETDPDLVHMELDLGWVVMANKNPLDYFERFPGRFPLWHLKDMDKNTKENTEFGKGILNIVEVIENQKRSGVEHIFIEQEEYASTPLESMKHNMDFLRKLE
ncbi:sugar phosphate isomerase/epimerase [Allomuricauda sp. NBRC 101325]|uniref:sugar phosphate isomerase/epimerase family protein n=1 Tax=Allomuricauda sp. NBRC 101325 TaxID=1113758 RepID=UPI0024A5BDFE|nr:sugar phosphate isomerase/epimerase [Muricauda sp. NBRC 101325]GLU43785.1 sugar phosphate isomerase [Muricauda sp. NBRC 101325]